MGSLCSLPCLEILQSINQNIKVDCLLRGLLSSPIICEGASAGYDTSGESKSYSLAKASLDCAGVSVL